MMSENLPKVGDLRIWWVPQIPMKAFFFPVPTVEEGARLLKALALYDLFQYENNVKPDYANAGGLMIYEEDSGEGEPGWTEWMDEETGDDIDKMVRGI